MVSSIIIFPKKWKKKSVETSTKCDNSLFCEKKMLKNERCVENGSKTKSKSKRWRTKIKLVSPLIWKSVGRLSFESVTLSNLYVICCFPLAWARHALNKWIGDFSSALTITISCIFCLFSSFWRKSVCDLCIQPAKRFDSDGAYPFIECTYTHTMCLIIHANPFTACPGMIEHHYWSRHCFTDTIRFNVTCPFNKWKSLGTLMHARSAHRLATREKKLTAFPLQMELCPFPSTGHKISIIVKHIILMSCWAHGYNHAQPFESVKTNECGSFSFSVLHKSIRLRWNCLQLSMYRLDSFIHWHLRQINLCWALISAFKAMWKWFWFLCNIFKSFFLKKLNVWMFIVFRTERESLASSQWPVSNGYLEFCLRIHIKCTIDFNIFNSCRYLYAWASWLESIRG